MIKRASQGFGVRDWEDGWGDFGRERVAAERCCRAESVVSKPVYKVAAVAAET